MAKRIKIVGSCKTCERKIGSDMRPINDVNLNLEQFKYNEPNMDDVSFQDFHSIARQQDNEDDSEADLVDPLLEIVKKQFELGSKSDTNISVENAELVMAVLKEEQLSYDKFLIEGGLTPIKKRRH